MKWFWKRKKTPKGTLKDFCPYCGGINPVVRSFGYPFKAYNGTGLALVTDGSGAYIKAFDGTKPWPDYDKQTQIRFCPFCGRHLSGEQTLWN